MYGMQAVWSPILHFHAATGDLFLFYSESRKVASPGGDIKVVQSADAGATWSAPRTLLTHEHDGGRGDGGVPKVLANKLCVLNLL
jgi:hypothetical protein